ncbi:Uncharacterised protein [Enterobacter cloacae]|uniref:Uncharacterized protein n=1 Tax=Enterobacter cloacae TaxID=550 RepID=A0A377LZB8_ENTCL|nr:Uncharacterised protein [Enterobacter cloacae]
MRNFGSVRSLTSAGFISAETAPMFGRNASNQAGKFSATFAHQQSLLSARRTHTHHHPVHSEPDTGYPRDKTASPPPEWHSPARYLHRPGVIDPHGEGKPRCCNACQPDRVRQLTEVIHQNGCECPALTAQASDTSLPPAAAMTVSAPGPVPAASHSHTDARTRRGTAR